MHQDTTRWWVRILMHLQTFLFVTERRRNGCRSAGNASKPEYQSGRTPRKVEPAGVNDVEVDVTKGTEVANVATQADMTAEKEHRATAEVPRELAVVEAQHIGRVDVGTNCAQTGRHIRPEPDAFLAADGDAEQQIARWPSERCCRPRRCDRRNQGCGRYPLRGRAPPRPYTRG